MKAIRFLIALAYVVAICSGCSARYVRMLADEIDGFMAYGPFVGKINAKGFLYISTPGKGNDGQSVYEISDRFYSGIKQPGGKAAGKGEQ